MVNDDAMFGAGGPAWAKELHRVLLANFPAFTYDPAPERAFATWFSDLGGYRAEVERAAFGLLMDDGRHLPNGPEVRRRVIDDAGLLAPPFAKALVLLARVSDGAVSFRDLPGPVRTIDVHALNAGAFSKTIEEAYAVTAREHDRRVLAPGGLAELCAAAAWIDAVNVELDDRFALPEAPSGEPVPMPADVRERLHAYVGRAGGDQ